MGRWAQREVHVWYLVMDHFFTVKYSEEGQGWMVLWENEPFTIHQRLLSHFLQKKEERKKEKEKVEKLEKTPRWVIKPIKTVVIY